MEDTRHFIFIGVINALSSLHQSVMDEFFSYRLSVKMNLIIESYVNTQVDRPNVAQSIATKTHLADVNGILEFVEELKYLKIGQPTPLAITHDRILRYKLSILKKHAANPVKTQTIKAESKRDAVSSAQSAGNLNQNAEKIFSFVRTRQCVRTKEIVHQFSALSERTVKRSLKELTRQGLLKKESANRAMYYSAV